MKKVALLLLLLILMTIQIPSMAEGINSDETQYELIFVDGTELSEAKQEMIRNIHFYGIYPISTRGIFCLFGHSIEEGSIELYTHNISTTSPRCKVSIYWYEACKRSSCDYYVSELIATMPATCH